MLTCGDWATRGQQRSGGGLYSLLDLVWDIRGRSELRGQPFFFWLDPPEG